MSFHNPSTAPPQPLQTSSQPSRLLYKSSKTWENPFHHPGPRHTRMPFFTLRVDSETILSSR